MQKIAIFILVALAVQVQAARINNRKVQPEVKAAKDVQTEAEQAVAEEEEEKAVAEEEASAEAEEAEEEKAVTEDTAEDEREAVANPQDAYWYTHQGTWEFVAPSLMHNEVVQQYELKEDYRSFRTKKYDVKLEEYEDPNSGMEVRKHINAKVLKVTNYFFTMHAHQSAVFKNEQGTQAGEYIMFNPQFFNRRYTWRVAKMDDQDNILFTIQKRLYNDHCKYLGFFSCRPVIKVYVGRRGDKSSLIYYGVGDKDLEEPDFKFYHSKKEYETNKKNWAAKVDHKKHKGNEEDVYKVKVKPNEDAGLLLLASVCLDKVGDDMRQPEVEHHDFHD